MENKNKRGELTSRQLIIIIILIISFAIIIAFFFMLDLKGSIDKESCRNSVMMKRIPFVDWVVSLKCKTQDVCFSMGGDCEREVDVVIKVGDTRELLEKIDELQKDCWWMMGEGKVNYGKGNCAICYKISFDEDIKDILPSYLSRNSDKEHIIFTGITGEDEFITPSIFVFNTNNLEGCSKYVTEV